MTKNDDLQNHSWGTWEELLLACAVNRHGTRNWDSVAMELQNRTSCPLILTAQNCRHKYHDLRRRFVPKDGKVVGDDDGDDEKDVGDQMDIPWLEELRKIRVAELKREVQRYDVSIVSLQLKVKKLTEERERGLKDEDNGEEGVDLAKDVTNGEGDAEKEKAREDGKSSPENLSEKRPGEEESERENRSFNESNSTDSGGENRETELGEPEKIPEERFSEQETAVEKRGPDPADSPEEKPLWEGSYNGSSDTVAKDPPVYPPARSRKTAPLLDTGESTDFLESVAESNGAKESSDVQSSASLSKKAHRKRKQSGSGSGEDPETDGLSPVSKRICLKSRPLVRLLEIIRSHRHGSLFERRLESQEGEVYQRLIRQHVDLDMVRSKLEEGLYSDNNLDFFRDLLLLFNNAIVFFPKNSIESAAALQLRSVVSKEIGSAAENPNPPSKKEPIQPPGLIPKPDPEPPKSLLPANPRPLIVCRKRSSIAAKAAVFTKAVEKQRPEEAEEKPNAEAKPQQPDDSSAILATTEVGATKKRSRERFGTGARGSRTAKGRNYGGKGLNSNPTQPNTSSNPNPGSAGKTASPEEDNADKISNISTVAKKRSAANFLNRMKRSTTPPSGTLLEKLKNSVGGSSKTRGAVSEVKKGAKGDSRRDPVIRLGSPGKPGPANSSPLMKRSVGRPPKRAAMQQPAGATSVPTRGRKEAAETEGKAPARKRTRR